MANKVYEMAFELGAKLQSSFSGAFDSANSKLAQLASQSRELKGQMTALEKAATKSALAGKYFSDAYGELAGKLAATERQQKSLTRAMGMQKQMEGMRDKSRNAMMGAVETGAVLYGPVKSAVDFETAMSGVAKQVDGARDDAGELTNVYYDMQEQVRETALDMGVMPSKMADTYAMTAKLGVQGSENIEKMSRAATMLGPAFEMDQTVVVEQLAQIGNGIGFSLKTEDGINNLLDLADTINYLDDQSVAKGQDIMDVMKRSSGMIREGSLVPTLQPKSLAALATGMLEMGETSETAATALNAMFVKFSAAPAEAKSFQLALANMGWSAEELQNGVINDAEGTIFEFFNDLAQLDMATRNNVMSDIFGKEHIDNLSKLAGGTKAFTERIRDANSEAAKGSVLKEYINRQKTTAAKLERAQAAVMNFGITIGTHLLPALSDLAIIGANGFKWMAKFAKDNDWLSGVLIKTAAGVLGLVTATSALWYIGTVLITPFVSMYTWLVKYEVAAKLSAAATWLWNGALAAGRWLLSVGRLAAYYAALGVTRAATLAAAGATWLWNAAMTAGSWLLSAGRLVAYYAAIGAVRAFTLAWAASQWLLNAAMTANPIGLVVAGIAALVAAGVWLYNNWDMVQAKLTELWDEFSTAYPNIAATVETYIGYVVTFWQGLGGKIASAIDGLPDIIKAPFVTAFDWLGEKFNWLENKWASLKGLFSGGGGSGTASDGNLSWSGMQLASGGVFRKGAFLTSFAEEGAEAAIPLDGSKRSAGLWATAGRMMGLIGGNVDTEDGRSDKENTGGLGNLMNVFSGQRPLSPIAEYANSSTTNSSVDSRNTVVQFNPSITISGSDISADVVMQAMRTTVDDLERRLADIRRREERLSYV